MPTLDPATKVIELFHEYYKTSKAYKQFVDQHALRPQDIQTSADIEKIPIMDKHNYIEKYPIEDRLKSGKELADHYMICTSSGSTGNPTIWPRDYTTDGSIITLNQELYQKLFDIKNRSTLVVVTFGLGAWTAGMLTSRLLWEGSPTYKISVVTPGLDKVVALRVLKSLTKYYDQTVITGYPPFIIELIEYGLENKFDFKSVNTKIHFTSARVSEQQRNELVKAISKDVSRYDVLGFYACAESGIIGIETPEIVDVLDMVDRNVDLCQSLFLNPNPPTLVEYNPGKKFLEVVMGNIVITADQPVPLVRFDLNDRGGLLSGEQIISQCNKFEIKIPASLKGKNYVYIHGRTDSVRILCNIYTDDIQYCLEMSKFKNKFSGNFKYGIESEGLKNKLKMIIYLKNGKNMSVKDSNFFSKEIYENLAKVNQDFRMVTQGITIGLNIIFEHDDPLKYKSGKLKHFLNK